MAASASSSATATATTGGKKQQQSAKYAGGGGILVLVDTQPSTGEPEWVLSLADKVAAETAAAAEANGDAAGSGNTNPTAGTTSGPGGATMDEDTSVVEPPAPFEVSLSILHS